MRVLVTEPTISSAIDKLREHFDVVVGTRGDYYEEQKLIDAAEQFDGILTMLSDPVTRNVLGAGDRLKIVANYAVGYNNIDTVAAKELGVRIANTPGVLTESTAEIALILLLSVARRTTEAEQHLRDHQFKGWGPKSFLGLELDGATVGIVGLGRIGTAFARRAKACGMKILYHNRNRAELDIEQELGAHFEPDLDQMLKKSDAISIHCPLTDETHHLIHKERFEQMPDHAILINTSRGPVLDEAALAVALHTGEIGGAGLDVYEEEPDIHPNLLTAPNTVLLPHIGSATHKSRNAMADLAATAIIGVLQGKPDSEIPNLVV